LVAREILPTDLGVQGFKVADFVDAALIRELDQEGFFARMEKQ